MSDQAHILLVDDDPDLLRLLTIRLKVGNYRVTAVGSAEAALARLAVELPALVITDVQLPGRDGLALFDDIRRQHSALPVILLNAHGTIPDAVDATARGAFAYLTKPFDGKLLMEKVAYAVNLSTVMPTPASSDESWRAELISRSAPMAELLAEARLVAGSDASILIRGASGTGKELLPRAAQRQPPRQGAVYRCQLWCDPRAIAGVGIVWPRERIVHGGGGQPRRLVPGSRWRHFVPG